LQFTREINRVLAILLILFMIVAFCAGYWAAFGAETILQREDNPRLVLDELSILRGDILDRDGDLLATSIEGEDGIATRRYPEPASYSAVGYYSYRYGVNGAEAAYDDLLSGRDDLDRYWLQDMLHLPRHGTNLQLTFSLDIQKTLVGAMGDYAGAAVVLSVPDGEVLALVSLPTYDPNVLDMRWEAFVAAPGNLFFNRVLQGGYQPGGTLQTPLLATALVPTGTLSGVYEQADAPVMMNGLTLNCLATPPSATLTLTEAYLYGCPAPFVSAAEQLGMDVLQQLFERFKLSAPPTLNGFVVTPPTVNGTSQPAGGLPLQATAEATAALTVQDERDVLGQGALTVNPLTMALICAAVINAGNAPTPITLLATQAPNGADWLPARNPQSTFGAMMTAETAQALRTVMERNVREGIAQGAQQADLRIGGHVALAYAGDSTQVWFIGFVLFEDGRGAAIALVLEDSADIALAAQIGGQGLAAAAAALRPQDAQ
jgi:peptidoglycan glycosyltransferase